MTRREKCHICGHENDCTYYSEDVGLVESHYHCENCGFTEEMAYGPFVSGFCDYGPKQFLQHSVVRLKNWKKVRKAMKDESYRPDIIKFI